MGFENVNTWESPFFSTMKDKCEICGKLHEMNECNLLGATIIHVEDKPSESYARLTLPDGLVVHDMGNNSTSVFTTKSFAKGVQFGPFIAKTSPLMDVRIQYPLKIFLNETESVYLETYEEIFCNWMCFINLTKSYQEQNMFCYQIQESIYFCTIREIKAGEELKAWYAPYYAERLGISQENIFDDCLDSLQPNKLQNNCLQMKTEAEVMIISNLTKKRTLKKIYTKENAPEILDHAPPTEQFPGELLGARENRKEWHCPTCGKVETTVPAYAKHLMMHNKPPKKIFECPYCTRKFSKQGYNYQIHTETCKDIHNKKLKDNDLPVIMNTEETKMIVDNNSCEQEQGMLPVNNNSLSQESVASRTHQNGDPCSLDAGKPPENRLANITQDMNVTSNTNEAREYNVDSIMLKPSKKCNQISCFQETDVQLNINKLETQNTNCQNYDWSNITKLNGKNIDEDEKLAEIVTKNNCFSNNISESNTMKLSLNTPILDLSDDYDFSKVVDMICEESDLGKSTLCSRSAKTSFFDCPTPASEQELASQDSCPFFSIEKDNFLPSSFTSCVDMTDEEKNRIVESFLSETFHNSDFGVTDGCCSDPDADFNISIENNNEAVKGKEKKKAVRGGDFKCDICGKCYHLQKYLYRHLRSHTGEFVCPVCYMVFARKETLQAHKQNCLIQAQNHQVATKAKITCKYCKLEFHSLEVLKAHFETHYCKGDSWKCCCGMISDDVDLILGHECPLLRRVHCNKCKKLFSTPEEYTIHKYQDILIGKKKFIKDSSCLCEICGLTFQTATGIRLHRMDHGAKTYECDKCDKKFRRPSILNKHKGTHQNHILKCRVCMKGCTSEKNLENHYKRMHSKTQLMCKYCDKVFNGKGNLDKHLRTHENSDVLQCMFCKKLLDSKMSLDLHIAKKHSNNSATPCVICGKLFYKQNQLKRHIKQKHKQIFKCSYCEMHLSYRQSLKTHLRRKHGDKINEWNSVEALQSMIFEQEPRNVMADDISTTRKDILQSASEDVIDGADEVPDSEIVYNMPLSFVENLQLSEADPSQNSLQHPLNFNLDTLEGSSSELDSAIISFQTMAELALNDQPISQVNDQDEDGTALSLENNEGGETFILVNGPLDESSVALDNNILYYIIKSP